MVPDLILVPVFFGPQEFWPLTKVPKKFKTRDIWAPRNWVPAYKCLIMIFMWAQIFEAQISWGLRRPLV